MRLAMGIVITLGVCSATLGCGSSSSEDDDSPQATAKRCNDLREHVIDLRLAPASGPKIDLAPHRAALRRALGTKFLEHCTTDLTTAQVKCALAAQDSSGVVACSEPAPATAPTTIKTAQN